MRYQSIQKIETSDGDILFNRFDVDALICTPSACSGFDQAPRRTPISRKAATDGARAFPFPKAERYPVLAGWLSIVSATDDDGYFDAVDALVADTIAKLDLIVPDDEGSLVWASGSLGIFSMGGAEFPPQPDSFIRRFTIPLVAVNPDPS